MQKLAQRIKDGDPTALNEIQHLSGNNAATLLEILREDKEAYKEASIQVLQHYWKITNNDTTPAEPVPHPQ